MIPAILSLLDRLHHIEQVCQTLTDRTTLTADALTHLDGCEIWPQDLATFRGIVAGGKLKSAKFKPPNGYKILDFLTLLCHLQEEKREKDWQAERDELNRLFKTMPIEYQEKLRAWLKRPVVIITTTQTVQLYKNA